MNLLTDDLPKSVTIDGKEHVLKTDYRYALHTMLAFEDPDLTSFERTDILIKNTFYEIPGNQEEALKVSGWFLNGGKEYDDTRQARRLVSFEKDANLIYAAFNSTHRIDLQEIEEMHWWRFLALFTDLGSETAFGSLTTLRHRYYSGKCTKEEKAAITEMGDAFLVEDIEYLTIEEMEAERALDEIISRG